MAAEGREKTLGRSIGRRFVQLAMPAALLLAVIAAIGCGSGGDETTADDGPGQDAFPIQFVTDDEIAAQDEGTPGRALLEWWQAYQFQDAITVLDLTSKEAFDVIKKRDLEQLVKTRGQGLQGIQILDTTERGDSASIRAGLLSFAPEEPGGPPAEEPSSSVPVTFEMANDGDGWLYNSPEFLVPQIENMKNAEAAATEESSGGESSGDSN